MNDQEREEIAAEIAAQIGSVMAAANLEACAVIAALAERQAIVPARVAAWAQFFAEDLDQRAKDRPVNGLVAARLREFADTVHNMGKLPAGAGRA